jgi:hypothetical protein
MQRLAALVALCLLASACASSSTDRSNGKVAAAAGKPVQLFNGKDLTGWTAISKDPNTKTEDVWSVVDGAIHCKGKPAGYLRTDADYTNFVLRFEWRNLSKGNSGCLIRVQPPDKVWPKSIECQLQTGNAGDIWIIDQFPMTVDESRRNPKSPRNIIKLEPSSEKPLGEWNQYEITMDGQDLTLKVNGVVQNRATDVEEVPGKILFQSEGAQIEFRNVVLTPLPSKGGAKKSATKPMTPAADATKSADPATTQEAADRAILKSLEVKRLPGLDGWFVTGNGNWTYHDGVIEGQQTKDTKTYTHVITDKIYKNLRASLQFKAVKGNSGFYFHAMPDAKGLMHGIQCEIDETRDAGGLYESYGRQWIVNPDDAENAKYFKPQDWNLMTLEVIGDHIVTHVNGVKVADIHDPKGRSSGVCALQIHGGQDVHVMFRDIQIKALPE